MAGRPGGARPAVRRSHRAAVAVRPADPRPGASPGLVRFRVRAGDVQAGGAAPLGLLRAAGPASRPSGGQTRCAGRPPGWTFIVNALHEDVPFTRRCAPTWWRRSRPSPRGWASSCRGADDSAPAIVRPDEVYGGGVGPWKRAGLARPIRCRLVVGTTRTRSELCSPRMSPTGITPPTSRSWGARPWSRRG